MKYWYDTEFYEDGSTIDLISFGMVAEDGRELYLENVEFDWGRVPEGHWLWDNVWPHLAPDSDVDFHLASRKAMAEAVKSFVTQDGTELDNELWGYFSSYDHVVLAQLFGRMVELPEGVPMYTNDVQQECVRRGLKARSIPQDGPAHNALADARWTKLVWEWLQEGVR